MATPRCGFSRYTDGLTVYVWNPLQSHTHLVYTPSLCVLLRGEKEARVAGRTFVYNSSKFFFTAVPLAAKLVVRGTSSAPLVGLVLELDIELVARVSLEIDEAGSDVAANRTQSDEPSVMFTGELSPRLVDTLDRLVTASLDPVRHRILHVGLLREVLFELLIGPQGQALRASLDEQSKLRALIDVMRFMEVNSAKPLAVPDLARKAGMSESGFYAKFREATGTTPLQYLKVLRLSKARFQLAAGGSVTEVAFEVGYSSGAQFSRDFRRAFGHSPSDLKH